MIATIVLLLAMSTDTTYALPVESWYEYDTVPVADTFIIKKSQHFRVKMVSKEKYFNCIDKAVEEMLNQCYEKEAEQLPERDH